jgi:hypothetical protein
VRLGSFDDERAHFATAALQRASPLDAVEEIVSSRSQQVVLVLEFVRRIVAVT